VDASRIMDRMQSLVELVASPNHVSPNDAREEFIEALDATDARRFTPTEPELEREETFGFEALAYPEHTRRLRVQVPQCGCTSSHLTLACLQSMQPLRDRVAMTVDPSSDRSLSDA
jgi:hypothetical protein